MKRFVLVLAVVALLGSCLFGQSAASSSRSDNRVTLKRIAQDDRAERRERKDERKQERREEKRERKRHRRHKKHHRQI